MYHMLSFSNLKVSFTAWLKPKRSISIVEMVVTG